MSNQGNGRSLRLPNSPMPEQQVTKGEESKCQVVEFYEKFIQIMKSRQLQRENVHKGHNSITQYAHSEFARSKKLGVSGKDGR